MPDLLVSGGGIIGLLTAREFSINGASVCLMDRQLIGREASWAAGGILSALYPWQQPEELNALISWSQPEYPKLANSLRNDTGIDPEWIKSGMLVLDAPESREIEEWTRSHPIEYNRFSAREVEKLASSLCLKNASPVFFPQIAQIRNPRLIAALKIDLRRRGVEIHESIETTGLLIEKQQVRGVKTNAGPFYADTTVLAAGARTGQISQVAAKLQLEPVKGQMILFKTEPGLLSSIIVDEGRYFIPRKDGHLLVGSTLERSGFDNSTTESGRIELEKFAYSRMPVLKQYAVRNHWAGLRPGTPSGIPFICKHPTIANLAINCGHYRNGIVTAPASARLLVDLVLAREPILPPEPYALERIF